MKVFSWTTAQLGSIMNQAKDIIANELFRQKIITKEQADSLRNEWALICVEKGWLGTTIDKIIFNKDDKDPSPIIKLVKMISDAKPEYEALEETESLLLEMIKDRPKNEVLLHPNAKIRALASKLHYDK